MAMNLLRVEDRLLLRGLMFSIFVIMVLVIERAVIITMRRARH